MTLPVDDNSNRTAAQIATRIFEIVERFQFPCGYERSFKMLPGKLLANRFMLGIETQHISDKQRSAFFRELNFPIAYRDQFITRWSDANLVLIGFEDNEPGCVYKLYLEFWDSVNASLSANASDNAPRQLHVGYKWNADNISRLKNGTERGVDNYIYFPRIPSDQIVERMNEICQNRLSKVLTSQFMSILKLAERRTAAESFIYLEVDQDARHSFDVNVYAADLKIGDVTTHLQTACDHFAIDSQKLERLLKIAEEKPLGHFSGGTNQDQQEFFTVYFESE